MQSTADPGHVKYGLNATKLSLETTAGGTFIDIDASVSIFFPHPQQHDTQVPDPKKQEDSPAPIDDGKLPIAEPASTVKSQVEATMPVTD